MRRVPQQSGEPYLEETQPEQTKTEDLYRDPFRYIDKSKWVSK